MTSPREGDLATVLRFYDMYNAHDVDLLDDLLSPEYVGEVNGQRIVGPGAAKRAVGAFLAAFPDVRYEVQDTVVGGARVATRWRAVATHLGPFAGLPPCSRRVTLIGQTLFQLEEGRIRALWNVWDVHGLLEQVRS